MDKGKEFDASSKETTIGQWINNKNKESLRYYIRIELKTKGIGMTKR